MSNDDRGSIGARGQRWLAHSRVSSRIGCLLSGPPGSNLRLKTPDLEHRLTLPAAAVGWKRA